MLRVDYFLLAVSRSPCMTGEVCSHSGKDFLSLSYHLLCFISYSSFPYSNLPFVRWSHSLLLPMPITKPSHLYRHIWQHLFSFPWRPSPCIPFRSLLAVFHIRAPTLTITGPPATVPFLPAAVSHPILWYFLVFRLIRSLSLSFPIIRHFLLLPLQSLVILCCMIFKAHILFGLVFCFYCLC